MSQSWHAFVFGALDPSGGVSVDKPPVDLWAQVVSVKLLGYNPTALKLPQALAGTLSIPLLYDIVRRGLGRPAGLAAAAALAVLPITVLTARSDTMDTLMAFVVLVSAWCVIRSLEQRKMGWLLAAGAAAGLAFNVKLFQALLPLPALALCWLVGARMQRQRMLVPAIATVVVALVVAFAWIVPVALTPRADRPYPIGSTNGSIWNLVFVFNGLDRLKGRPVTTPDTLPAGSKVPAAIVKVQKARASKLTSDTGVTRLLGPRFAARIGSELVTALAVVLAGGALAAFALVRRRRGSPPGTSSLWIPIAVLFTSWLVLDWLLFSTMKTFHPRYFEAVSPAVAAVAGGGLCFLAIQAGRLGRLAAALVVLATGIYIQMHAAAIGTAAHIEFVACLATAIGLGALALRRSIPSGIGMAAAAIAVGAVLIGPLSASLTVVRTHAFDAERSGHMPNGWPRRINRYLEAGRHGSRYLVASIAPAKAAPLIAAKPEPVLMLTSYRSRPLLGVPQLESLVRKGEVRYFLIGRRCVSRLTRGTAACPATARWAIAHSVDVTHAAGVGHKGLIYKIKRGSLP